MDELPLTIVRWTVWTYWAGVLVMAIINGLRHQRDAALLPRDPAERAMWLLWVPVIILWNALPAFGDRREHWLLAVPEVLREGWPWWLRLAAAALAVLTLLATMLCWARLGRNWSVGVVPGTATDLVTAGPYALARHPIYALSILLMLLSLLVLPTLPMLLIAGCHIVLMNLKAANEERFLREVHGEAYREYARRVGRFVPRPRQVFT